MAISDAVQTLSAAFSFGILLQAATGALFIYYRGHGSTIFQDGRRLVLILFLLFAALWAQVDFLNLLLSNTMATACQATLIISTLFDQLSRVGIEQFLLWSVGNGSKLTAERLILQGVLFLRLIGGGLLVGFTRPQFAPVCVAQTSVLPISIVVLALDAIIVGVLLVRAISLGMFGDLSEKSSSTRQEQSKALIFSIIAFGVWTGTSVPMILGIPTIILIVRTVLPANGLLILVGVVTMFPGALLLAREENGTTPEARSPFVTPMPPSREIFRDNVRSNGSPVSNHTYTKSGSLFVVNPSAATPHDSPTAVFQSSSRGDTRGFTKLGNEINARETDDRPQRPDRLEVKGPGYRGSSGVFPALIAASQGGVQAALAPQIRPSVPAKPQTSATFPEPASVQKRSMFNWSKAPAKPTVRSLGISQPISIPTDGATPQPFAKIQTIDLATAANMERERREEASARSRLVANRPAPQPPQFSTQEALRRSISVKRKEMPSHPTEVMPAVPVPSSSGLSRVATNGTTTSASLSPGREEVRRRSPRQVNSFDQTYSENAANPTLQRKRTIGLPSNPRATRITMAQEVSIAKPQTVMFMNDIVYDNPGMVKTIIKDAPAMYASAQMSKPLEKSAFSVTTTSLKSSNSVIHRPRPYKRERNDDRALFPSEPSPGHRRSRSGSSITPRKSFLMSQPGSPTQLPPLPPPPITSAANLKRLLPNDTKSMTFDEKIELLFPAPPGPITSRSRRSSVPSLPRLPSVFMAESPTAQSPTEEEHQNRRASKRTTIASFAIPEIVPPPPPKSLKRQSVRPEETQAYRFSVNTYRTIADEVGETWIPGIPAQDVNPQNSLLKAPQRQSVLDDMRKSHWTEATSSDEGSTDDVTTYWGSVHSEIPPVDLSKARHNANSLYIHRPDAQQQQDGIHDLPRCPLGENEALVPMILESEENRRPFLLSADDNRRSFLLDADQSLPGDRTPITIKNEHGWHHRIGDELPTFSERSRSNSVKRKMPPPTPLLLGRTGKRATVVVRNAEPSPPTDSPERAIQEIQEQLKRFEEQPSRGSVGSLLRRMPNSEMEGAPDTGHLRLLDNLEKEMGQQENHWQQMQTDLDRDSMSVTMSPFTQAQSEESEGNLSRESSQRSTHTPSGVMSRRARVRSSMTVRSKSDDSSRTTSTQSSDNSRASVWQQRLAEAQIEYMENAPTLLQKKSLNFLSISKGHAPIMSPTPPESLGSETDIETDAESDSDTEAIKQYQAPQVAQKERPTLWQPSLPSPKAAVGRMWNPPYETSDSSAILPEPPAKSVRPAQRRLEHALPMFSTELWTKPRSSEHSRPVVGLWGSRPTRPRSIKTRPLTQRPQRKSRRITFLPDIVESPVPLPNKRETLGIFQFPWGETSDQPVYQPAFNPALIAAPVGPVLNAKLDARSKQLEPDQPEYSSSFFDDYEEEDEELDDPESDDDFDETTLWEIASLLNSRDVPSKNSLLPNARSETIDDYDSDSGPESPDNAAPPPVSRLPIQPLTVTSRSVAQLWAGDSSPSLEAAAPGLPQPESAVWNALVPSADDIVRSKPRSTQALPVLYSTDLWTASEAELPNAPASFMWSNDVVGDNLPVSSSSSNPSTTALMWSPKENISDNRKSGIFTVPSEVIRTTDASPAAIKMVKAARPSAGGVPVISSNNLWTRLQNLEETTSWISKSSVPRQVHDNTTSSMMWSPAAKVTDVDVLGLFNSSLPRSNFRSSDASPAAINMICKPRKSLAPLSKLTSSKLWNGRNKLAIEHHWISESSTRPESPSVYSTTSSGNSSPASDSASLKSTSTKASSIWSASLSAIPTWGDRSAKKSPSGSPKDDAKHPSKIPVRQPSQPPLAPVRESRVLASRDLWESKAPVLEKTPVRKFRRASVAQPSAIPVQTPARRRHRPVASSSDWDNALAEAVSAGVPKKISRPVARKSDWDSALSEAVSKSKTRLPRPVAKKSDWESALSQAISQSKPRFQRTADSPAKWEAALAEAINAGASKPTTTKAYDASVLHPVFFTRSLISTVTDIHPAAIGYVIQTKTQSGMWTRSSVASIPKPAALWSKGTVSPRTAVVEMKLIGDAIRKAPVARTVELSTLQSKSFWSPYQVAPKERNWLTATATKTSSAQTWIPRTAPAVDDIGSTTMWTARASPSHASPDMFAHVKANHIKAASTFSRPIALPRLNSNELFTISPVTTKTPNWLHETSTKASPQTWVPRAISPALKDEISKTMWAPQPASSPSSPDMFVDVKGRHIKQASSCRPAALSRLNSAELFNASSASTSQSNTHWLHETSLATLNSAVAKPDARSLTWTAPATTSFTKQEGSMWQAQSTTTTLSPTLFTNPHSESWSRKKRDTEVLAKIESTDLWRPSRDMPESPKHWLIKRRFSRVEFRY